MTDYNEVKDETHVGLPPIYLDKEFAVQAAYFVSGATIKRPDEVYLHFAHLSDTRHWSEVNVVYFAQGNTRVHYDASTPKSGQRKSGGWESIDVWMPVDKFQQLVDGDRLLIQIGNDNLTVSGEHIKPFKEFSSEIPSS